MKAIEILLPWQRKIEVLISLHGSTADLYLHFLHMQKPGFLNNKNKCADQPVWMSNWSLQKQKNGPRIFFTTKSL